MNGDSNTVDWQWHIGLLQWPSIGGRDGEVVVAALHCSVNTDVKRNCRQEVGSGGHWAHNRYTVAVVRTEACN